MMSNNFKWIDFEKWLFEKAFNSYMKEKFEQQLIYGKSSISIEEFKEYLKKYKINE